MNEKTELQKVSEEIMRFMRGKYEFDEIGNGTDELKFCDGDETIFTIYIRDEYYDFAFGQEITRVTNLDTLKKIKKSIITAKKPNRKPFPKTHIHKANCGHRCDLCVHYKGETSYTAEEKEYRIACHNAVYGNHTWEENCNGCHFPDCTVESADCRKGKGIEKCWDCEKFSSCLKTAGWPPEIHTRTITADQVTWAILPYVKGQYGN